MENAFNTNKVASFDGCDSNYSWLKFFGYGYKDSVSGEKVCGLFVLNVFRIVPGGGFNVPELFTIVILVTLW